MYLHRIANSVSLNFQVTLKTIPFTITFVSKRYILKKVVKIISDWTTVLNRTAYFMKICNNYSHFAVGQENSTKEYHWFLDPVFGNL